MAQEIQPKQNSKKELLSKGVGIGIFLLGATILAVVFFLARSKPPQQDVKADLPSAIIASADKMIISKVGKDFFAKYISLDRSISQFSPALPDCFTDSMRSHCGDLLKTSHYYIAYKFYMPEKPYVRSEIYLHLDEAGNLFPNTDIEGIPDCISRPEECEFLIDEAQAKSIAESRGLEKGIKSWRVSFIYDGAKGTFAWIISTTLREQEGKNLIIDANNGAFIELTDWSYIE